MPSTINKYREQRNNSVKDMCIIKYSALLILTSIGMPSFAQFNSAPAISTKANICLEASKQAFKVANDKNHYANLKITEAQINQTNLPSTQKDSLIGLAQLLEMSEFGEKINFDARQIAINYYLSCMSVR